MNHQPYIAVGLVIAVLSLGVGVVAAVEATRPTLPADAGDLSAASRIEVKDAAGQVLFSGTFGELLPSGSEREKKAVLLGSGGSTCEAEIEIGATADGRGVQELEVDVAGIAPGTTLTVSVDDRPMGTLTADAKGEAELELSGAVTR